MRDADAIWAINHEQLVTATDRLLVGSVRGSVPSIASGARVAFRTPPLGTPVRARGTGTTPFVRGAHPRVVQRQVAPAGSAPAGGRGFAPGQLALGSSPGFVVPSLKHASPVSSRLARRSSADLLAGIAPVYAAPAAAVRARVAAVHAVPPVWAPDAAVHAVPPVFASDAAVPPVFASDAAVHAVSPVWAPDAAVHAVPPVWAPDAAVHAVKPVFAPDAYAATAPAAVAYGPRTTRAYASPAPSARTRAQAEQTLFVRAVRPRPFPVTIVIPMLLGIVAGLAAML
jgi:hypothetical protein